MDMPYFRRRMVYEILAKKLQKPLPHTPTEIQSTKLANFVREMYKNPLSCPVATGVATPVSKQKKRDREAKNTKFLKKEYGKVLMRGLRHGVDPDEQTLALSFIKVGMRGPDVEYYLAKISRKKRLRAERL